MFGQLYFVSASLVLWHVNIGGGTDVNRNSSHLGLTVVSKDGFAGQIWMNCCEMLTDIHGFPMDEYCG